MHLVVLHHGLWGNPDHLGFLEKELRSIPELVVLNIASNKGLQTYDGVDVCGERVVDEIQAFIEKNSSIKSISFMGYSAGGLVLRYAVGLLYSSGFFDTIKPIYFTTFATPHLGSDKPRVSIFNRFFNLLSTFFPGRTGRHLNLVDDKIPLLVRMASEGSCFYKGLALFRFRTLYANARNDRIVKFTTSSILSSNPHRKNMHYSTIDPKYESIVKASSEPHPKSKWTAREITITAAISLLSPVIMPLWFTVIFSWLLCARIYKTVHSPKPRIALKESDDALHDLQRGDMREYMINTLNKLEWQKNVVAMFFTNAHGAIVARNKLFSGNPDVIHHFCDQLRAFHDISE